MADLLSQLEALARSARKAIEAAADEKSLEDLRVRFLGKKGEVSQVLRGMGQLAGGGTVVDVLPAVAALLVIALVTGAVAWRRIGRVVAP